MQRFTIFTVILAVSVITIMGDLVLRDYFKNSSANVINSNEKIEPTAPSAAAPAPVPEATPPPAPVPAEIVPPAVITSSPDPTITQNKTKSAGFSAALTEEHFDGKIYQLLDITSIPVEGVSSYQLSDVDTPIASLTEIVLQDEIRALQLYTLLQNKTKPYIDLSLNETNAYGDRSFYINHAKKPDEAFLTVKIGRRVYAFAYIKLYHPQLKKLIQLLTF